MESQNAAAGWIARHVQVQAGHLAYINVFKVLMILSLLAIPHALALRSIDVGKKSEGPAH